MRGSSDFIITGGGYLKLHPEETTDRLVVRPAPGAQHSMVFRLNEAQLRSLGNLLLKRADLVAEDAKEAPLRQARGEVEALRAKLEEAERKVRQLSGFEWARVRFNGVATLYTYRLPETLTVEPGDEVEVEGKYGNRHGVVHDLTNEPPPSWAEVRSVVALR